MESRKSENECIRLKCKLSHPKNAEIPNEDSYQCSERLNVYALCDGASISYDSASWSKILARRFCQDQILNKAWLLDCIKAFNLKHDRDSLPWAKQAAFDKGSFSSLLGIVIEPESCEVRLTAVGDTMAFLCDGNRLVWSFPYETPEQFDDSPTLLSSNLALNDVHKEGRIVCEQKTCCLSDLKSPLLLCMTDALGKWLLETKDNQPNPIDLLRAVCKPKAFREFILAERSSGRLRKDDSTMLAFW